MPLPRLPLRAASMRLVVIALPLSLMLAACGKPAKPEAEDAWVRLPAMPGRPAAAYLTIEGGTKSTTLTAVTTPRAQRSELHETVPAEGQPGVVRMKPVTQVPVAARDEVSFVPGGRHIMLFGLDPQVAPGGRVPLRLTFADGQVLEVQAQAIGAGDPAPE